MLPVAPARPDPPRAPEPPPLPGRRRCRRRRPHDRLRPPRHRRRPQPGVPPTPSPARSTPICGSRRTTPSRCSRRISRWARAPIPASPRWSPRSSTPTGARCGSRVPGQPQALRQPRLGRHVQGTGGSSAMASSFLRYRQAGAIARAMLVAAASKAVGRAGGRGRGRARACCRIRPASGRPWASWPTRRADRRSAGRMQPATDLPLKDPERIQADRQADLARVDNVAKTTGARDVHASTSGCRAC